MSAAKVIDASALVAVLFDEPGGDGVRMQVQDAKLIGPDLLNIELASVCLMKIRRAQSAGTSFSLNMLYERI
jgi:uncharacterized protein with PIN domain